MDPARRDLELWEVFERIKVIRKAILKDMGSRKTGTGVIPCPACKKGNVGYHRSEDGDVRGRCSTPHCANWSD